jgi:hypothetical protein
MSSIGKSISLILILIITISSLSLMMIKLVNAQTSKPSVPEFTLKLVDYSSDTRAIELTIKNQPFVSYKDNGQIISLYYNVHFKLHDSDSWIAMYYCGDVFPTPSSSDYTKLDYPLQLTSAGDSSYYLLVYRENTGYYNIMSSISFNGQIDFRVQAMEGVLTSTSFTGQTSDWNIQTITIPGASTSPNPTSTPTIPEFSSVIVVTTALIVLTLAAISVFKRKTR